MHDKKIINGNNSSKREKKKLKYPKQQKEFQWKESFVELLYLSLHSCICETSQYESYTLFFSFMNIEPYCFFLYSCFRVHGIDIARFTVCNTGSNQVLDNCISSFKFYLIWKHFCHRIEVIDWYILFVEFCWLVNFWLVAQNCIQLLNFSIVHCTAWKMRLVTRIKNSIWIMSTEKIN